MSARLIDVSAWFEPCRYDGTTERRANPFTNRIVDSLRNDPLTDEEVAAVHDVIVRAGGVGPDGTGAYRLLFDGVSGRVSALDDTRDSGSLRHGCMFAIDVTEIQPSIMRFLFDLLVAGNWVIREAGDLLIAPTMASVRGVPRNHHVRVADSPTALAVILRDASIVAGGEPRMSRFRDLVERMTAQP